MMQRLTFPFPFVHHQSHDWLLSVLDSFCMSLILWVSHELEEDREDTAFNWLSIFPSWCYDLPDVCFLLSFLLLSDGFIVCRHWRIRELINRLSILLFILVPGGYIPRQRKQGKGMLGLLLNGGWTQRMIRGYTVNLPCIHRRNFFFLENHHLLG